MITITERGARDSCFGPVLQIKVNTPDYRLLTWREIWGAFTESYPGRWAIQVFPPRDRLVDSKAVYHLFVLDTEPTGLDLR